MLETEWQQIYRQHAQILGEIGSVLVRLDLPNIEVRLPFTLAEKAVAAWEREGDEGPPDPETFEQRVQRHRAGTLGLIGLTITTRGRRDGDEMVVELSPDILGAAVDAADDL